MELIGYEQVQSDDLGLPEGYSVKTRGVLEEESGEAYRALLLQRVDGSAAGLFAFSASSPTVEEVSQRAWDDQRATGGRVQ